LPTAKIDRLCHLLDSQICLAPANAPAYRHEPNARKRKLTPSRPDPRIRRRRSNRGTPRASCDHAGRHQCSNSGTSELLLLRVAPTERQEDSGGPFASLVSS
jgi:hypothetical protein